MAELRYRPGPDTRWSVEPAGVRLVRSGASGDVPLAYPEAALWDLLARETMPGRLAPLLAAIAGLSTEEAGRFVERTTARWLHSAYLEQVQTGGAPSPLAVPTTSAAATREAPAIPGETPSPQRWAIPFIDQPIDFWQRLAAELGEHVCEVYFPLPGVRVGSGRPPQSETRLGDFLRHAPFALSALLNPITLPESVEHLAPEIIERLRRLVGEHGLASVTVTNLLLGARIREALPPLRITASVLMDVEWPAQALMLSGVCDGLVPSGRIMRNVPALARLREAFPGRIRLIVNEACLPGCPLRIQHFQEMAGACAAPKSLCADVLARLPWLRLTGTWVLPQHLGEYAGLYDELKMAGRVTLRDPERYRRVLAAYVRRERLTPDAIGGGPASVLIPMEIEEGFFRQTLHCPRTCHRCAVCREYYERRGALRRAAEPAGRGDEVIRE